MSAVVPLIRVAPLEPGAKLGAFRLLHRLGAGGMGEVFLGEHEELGRRVALKVLNAEHLRNPRMHERFAREARLANRVRHANVVEVTELFWLPDGRPYMAMEYVAGVDVTTYVESELTESRFLSLAAQMADALLAAHGAGIVHRDLKPSNVLVTADGRIKLLDFGVAKVAQGEDDRLTQTGQVVATPSYMSPEQATGEPVDGRSDLYSLGIILWELIVGRRPFEGRSFGDLVLLHSTRMPPAPSKAGATRFVGAISPALDAIVMRCLAKRPEHRFANAGELRAAILAAGDHVTRERRVPKYWPLAVAAAALALTVPALWVALRAPSAPVAQAAPVVVDPLPPAPMEFTPMTLEHPPMKFAPAMIESTRKRPPRRARPARQSDGDLSSSTIKDPFGAAP
ncbi:MAG: Serine/threonine protein kinase [Myxococcales bacterium]|nr:Serine/threonine protein kinase [Myxococcales bacterium]